MDTIGGLIDKLITVDMKMWYAQEDFYKIRHMTFKEFRNIYFNENGIKELWEQFQKGIDLNLQRNEIIDEIDQNLVELIKALVAGEDVDGRFVQLKHKTY